MYEDSNLTIWFIKVINLFKSSKRKIKSSKSSSEFRYVYLIHSQNSYVGRCPKIFQFHHLMTLLNTFSKKIQKTKIFQLETRFRSLFRAFLDHKKIRSSVGYFTLASSLSRKTKIKSNHKVEYWNYSVVAINLWFDSASRFPQCFQKRELGILIVTSNLTKQKQFENKKQIQLNFLHNQTEDSRKYRSKTKASRKNTDPIGFSRQPNRNSRKKIKKMDRSDQRDNRHANLSRREACIPVCWAWNFRVITAILCWKTQRRIWNC